MIIIEKQVNKSVTVDKRVFLNRHIENICKHTIGNPLTTRSFQGSLQEKNKGIRAKGLQF